MPLADIHEVITALDQELSTGYSTQTKGNSYIDQRKVINELFLRKGCFVHGRQLVVQRLTILDALYSTNACFTYFAIDQMAEAILKVGDDQAVGDYFYSLVLGGKDTLKLFSRSYGFTKDLGSGRMMISLLSKYASSRPTSLSAWLPHLRQPGTSSLPKGLQTTRRESSTYEGKKG